MAYPNIALQQVNRGDPAPDPSTLPSSTPSEPMSDYVRVWTQNGWQYWRFDNPQAQAALQQHNPNVQQVRMPSAWGVETGYTDKADWSPNGPQGNTTPTGTVGSPSATNNAPGGPLSPGTGVPAEPGYKDGLLDANGQEAKGPWIRVTDYDNRHGDVPGIDIVRSDSITGTKVRNNPNAKWSPLKVQGLQDESGVPVPDEVALSQNFQQIAGQPAMKVQSVKILKPNTLENSGTTTAYQVTFKSEITGATGDYTFTTVQRGQDVDGRKTPSYMQVTADPKGWTGGSTASQAQLQQAQAEEAAARKALADAQTDTERQKAQDNLAIIEQKKKNLAVYGRYDTDEGIEKSGLTTAQTGAVGVQNQVAVTGAQNQTYTNILQYYRDIGVDERDAQRMAQDYVFNRAKLDNDNNTLVYNAGKTVYDNQTNQAISFRNQDVSLDNARLSAAGQNVDQAGRFALGLNDYLKPGSTKGGEAMASMMGLNYLMAKKYGALQDYPHPEIAVPTGLGQLANTPVTRLGSVPDYNEVTAMGRQTVADYGGDQRPAPPGMPDIKIPTVRPVGVRDNGIQRGVEDTTTPTQTSNPQTAPAIPPRSTNSQQRADGNERPDDILTIVDSTGDVQRDLPRSEWNASTPAQQGPWRVIGARADPARFTPPPSVQPRADGNERDDDILTLQAGTTTRQIPRSEWNASTDADRAPWTVVHAGPDPARFRPPPSVETPPQDPNLPANEVTRMVPYKPSNELNTSSNANNAAVAQSNNLLIPPPPPRPRVKLPGEYLFDNPQAVEDLFNNSDPYQYFY